MGSAGERLHLAEPARPHFERKTRRVAERAAHQRHARDIVDQRQTTQDLGKLVKHMDASPALKKRVCDLPPLPIMPVREGSSGIYRESV